MTDFSGQLANLEHEIVRERYELMISRQNSSKSNERLAISTADDNKNPTITSELISRLSLLYESHLKVSELISHKSVDHASAELSLFEAQVAEFNDDYPGTLLGVDLHRKVDIMVSQIDSMIDREWKDAAEISESHLLFNSTAHLSKRTIEANKDELMAKMDHTIIQPLLALKIDLKTTDLGLQWMPRKELPTLAKLAANVRVLGTFVSQAPSPLESLIPRRFGAQFVHKLLRQSLAKLYPNESDPSDFQNQLRDTLPAIEVEILSPHWIHSGEITRYVENFRSIWPEVRQEHYLMELRNIYSGPITEESRSEIVDWYEEALVDSATTKDDWDWDDDEEEKVDVLEPETGGLSMSENAGHLIGLWRKYNQEFDSPSLFYTMYRALVPVAYKANDLWIYEDTCKFLSHMKGNPPLTSNSHTEADLEPLIKLCDTHLDRFVKTKLNVYENELLPALFLNDHQRNEAVAKILSSVDELAVAVNFVGGPVLRESVTGLVVERVAVYVVSAIENMSDIGDSESQQLATIITRLSPLGVYFAQVADAVPSWTKMETLRDFLTGSLHSIGELLDQHRLLDFTPDELSKLLCALFQESSDRNRLVARFYKTLT